MLNTKKGAVIAMSVAGSLALAGCASHGTGSAACGDTTATPVAAPAPAVNACKGVSSCKHKMKKHHHKHHAKKIVKKDEAVASADNASTASATSATETK